jgi:phosphopantetheine adenylyltransferase
LPRNSARILARVCNSFSQLVFNKKIDTIALFADSKHVFLSSSIVKEILTFGGDISPYVPKVILPLINEKK